MLARQLGGPDVNQLLQAAAVQQAQLGQHPLPCRNDLQVGLRLSSAIGAFVSLLRPGCFNHLQAVQSVYSSDSSYISVAYVGRQNLSVHCGCLMQQYACLYSLKQSCESNVHDIVQLHLSHDSNSM